MSSHIQTLLDNQIAVTEKHAQEDAESIRSWYLLRRNQLLMELENVEKAYNARMVQHSVEWSMRLNNLHRQRDTLNYQSCSSTSSYTENVVQELLDETLLPPPPLERQKNIAYLSQEERDAALEFDVGIDVGDQSRIVVSDGEEEPTDAMDMC